MQRSQRYLKKFPIVLATVLRFPNGEKLVNREIETLVLNTINSLSSKKWVMTFSWIFHFSVGVY